MSCAQEGQGTYSLSKYLRERGDTNIRTIDDLITKARFFKDDKFHDPCAHFPSALFSRSSEHVAPSSAVRRA